ncbi:MAG: replication-associated recombination protein A [Bacteroidales bacterium]|nr:replication-associated recombination protein A [Bacteroidales bacterium]
MSDNGTPLPERMRPRDLSQYVGQQHLVGPGCILRNMIDSGNLSSFILWGPPGVGKTTLASIIAHTLDREFYTLSAVSSGVKDVRDVIDKARNKSLFSSAAAPILFIDEIHRFNKAQQDALLGAVESGTVVLIGATTENPSFEVITPLLSRCQVFVLKPLEASDLDLLLRRALSSDEVLSKRKVTVDETEALFRHSGGDARKLLNILEIVIDTTQPAEDGAVHISNKSVTACLQENMAIYDKGGEMHYDIISAFIKSVRGSDPNAAVYWMARMLAGGEDPLFIARRLCILAAEDIGLANPNALLLANACFDAVNKIGMPESRIILSECAIYLASSPKSNSGYMAINDALSTVGQTGNLSVPLHLRNAPTKLMEKMGYGANYKYAHDYEGNFVDQDFLPKELRGRKFYNPQQNPQEENIRTRLKNWWAQRYGY